MTDDITRARWNKAKSADGHLPVDALRMVIDSHVSGEMKLNHVIVVYASEPKDGGKYDNVGFFQTGPYPTTQAVGLLEFAKASLLEHLLSED